MMGVKKAIVFVAAMLLYHFGKAQSWGGGADQNDLSFGFSFQYIRQDYKIIKQPDWRTPIRDPETGNNLTSPLTSISSRSTPGFSVGFITRYRLSENLEARTTPALVFADRELNYTFENGSDNLTRQVQTTSVDVPLLLKLRSDRIGNVRAYILGGVKYSMAVSKGKPDENEAPLQQRLRNTRGFASYEAGFGFDIYFEYFKMSPEIKVGNSFGNVLVGGNTPLAAPINKLFLHSLMFSLHFE
ncbi:outer membrane beta-barrel protein [Mucilaginibacter sp. PAMB04274]|uniref:type IX secretion/gliding motility protein PorT/SprT n=1 Tax=Mucilaginibacter sp. PAMB04274 TaxID=3138568 RepID=UPI0031F65776